MPKPEKKQRRKAYDLRLADFVSVRPVGRSVAVSIKSDDKDILLIISDSLASKLAHHLQNQRSR